MGLRLELSEHTLIEHERFAISIRAGHDPADDDVVVAAGKHIVHRAFQMRQCTHQQGQTVVRREDFNTGEPIGD